MTLRLCQASVRCERRKKPRNQAKKQKRSLTHPSTNTHPLQHHRPLPPLHLASTPLSPCPPPCPLKPLPSFTPSSHNPPPSLQPSGTTTAFRTANTKQFLPTTITTINPPAPFLFPFVLLRCSRRETPVKLAVLPANPGRDADGGPGVAGAGQFPLGKGGRGRGK